MTARHKMLSSCAVAHSESGALTSSYNVILSSISFYSRMLDPSPPQPCRGSWGPLLVGARPGKTQLVYNQITKSEEHQEHVLDINIALYSRNRNNSPSFLGKMWLGNVLISPPWVKNDLHLEHILLGGRQLGKGETTHYSDTLGQAGRSERRERR